MNRRDFLQQTAVYALLGMALPLRSFSKDPPVKVAVVGTGGRGTDLIRKLSTIERAEIVAVCDDYAPHLKRGGDAAGPQAKQYLRYDEMLRNEDIQAVIVAVPLYLHFEMCRQAIARGCDVFCEKTMCHSMEEARRLADLVRANRTVFQVGLQRRASAIYRQAHAMVQTGMLGTILSIKSQWHRNNDWRRPVPVQRDHPDWQTLERRLNWRLYWPYSQGLMTELGAHQMDVANWMLDAVPARVVASGGNDYWRDGREVFDNVYCIYEYDRHDENGTPYTTRVTYSSIQSNAYEGASELIMGTRGTLLLTEKTGLFYKEPNAEPVDWQGEEQDETDGAAATITSGKTLQLSNDPWAHRGKPYQMSANSNSTRDQLIAFLDCVQQRKTETICPVEDGLLNTATVLIGNQAIKERREIAFPAGLL